LPVSFLVQIIYRIVSLAAAKWFRGLFLPIASAVV